MSELPLVHWCGDVLVVHCGAKTWLRVLERIEKAAPGLQYQSTRFVKSAQEGTLRVSPKTSAETRKVIEFEAVRATAEPWQRPVPSKAAYRLVD